MKKTFNSKLAISLLVSLSLIALILCLNVVSASHTCYDVWVNSNGCWRDGRQIWMDKAPKDSCFKGSDGRMHLQELISKWTCSDGYKCGNRGGECVPESGSVIVPTPTPITPTCSSNFQCGTDGYVGGAFCVGNNLTRSYRSFICYNPGIPDSFCSTSDSQVIIENCVYGCNILNGSCNSNPCIDNDGDGYDICSPGTTGDDGKTQDCNDNNAAVHPNAAEILNGIDDDCDGSIDEDCQVNCSTNLQCGANIFLGANYCVGNNSMKNFISFLCNNAGTPLSYCSNSTSPTLIESCSYGCNILTGNCNSLVINCSTNSQCGVDSFIGNNYCSGKNVVRDYRVFTCNNAGTPSSSCSSSTTAQIIQTCVYSCSNGVCQNQTNQTSQAISKLEIGAPKFWDEVNDLWVVNSSTPFNFTCQGNCSRIHYNYNGTWLYNNFPFILYIRNLLDGIKSLFYYAEDVNGINETTKNYTFILNNSFFLNTTLPYCGDGICNDGENSSWCPWDCSGNQTGNCTPNWSCGSWSKCKNKIQTRVCIDNNYCFNMTGKPTEIQSCSDNKDDKEKGEKKCLSNESIDLSNKTYYAGKNIINLNSELSRNKIPSFIYWIIALILLILIIIVIVYIIRII